MADYRKKKTTGPRRAANISSLLTIILLSADFIIESYFFGAKVNYSFAGLVIIVALVTVFLEIRYTTNHYKMAFNVPIVLFLFYTALLSLGNWNSSYFLLVCLLFTIISCLYTSFYRSVVFIIFQNILIGLLILRGNPVAGFGVPLLTVFIMWGFCLFSSIIALIITWYSTFALTKALESQSSFKDLLDTMENYVAMVDERNLIIYASKTLSQLGEVEEPTLVQGRPLLDLFPGRTLKLHAGKMLQEKDNYAEDWEFTLKGQKRYFKAASHALPGHTGGSLISLYDMTHLAERDEIAAMKDAMQIGLFFMDENFIIQDHYSRHLEVMLDEVGLFGRLFTDVIADSVSNSQLEAIKDYFGMVVDRSFDQDMLEDINPLNEFNYVNPKSGERKVLQCAFTTVEQGHGQVFILVTVYDITIRVELQKKLAEEEAKRQEEMQSVFELIQVEPDVFGDFSEDMDFEFGNIDKILKDNSLSAHEVLVKVYQAVHAIKSNAVILGLNVFGNKVHALESHIKALREMEEEVPFAQMLNLAMEIEKISEERENFKAIIDKLQSYGGSSGGEKQVVKVLIESLAKTTSKASEDMEKNIKFLSSDVDPEAVDKGPRRVMKEVLMQLIRNSVVHGIEKPEIRKKLGKNEIGIIKLSIKIVEGHIHMKLIDDGRGLDYKKIAEKAIHKKIIKPQDANNKDVLMKAIFMPGFSTAETEGVHAGRGIGLNLVRDRVKEVYGTIKLRSETGKGTVFFVSIPIPKHHPKPAPQGAAPKTAAPAQAAKPAAPKAPATAAKAPASAKPAAASAG